MISNSNTATAAEATATPCQLFPGHLADLESSGLTEATIKAAGIYSESDRRKLAAILNRKTYPASWGAALVFPYFDADGATIQQRIKPSNPPTDAKGKSKKYLQPTGTPNRAYIPVATRKAITDPAARLVVTEGEKKTLAATQAGFHCVGLAGIECWHPAKSMSLIPDLAAIAWKSRPVFIAFDSDIEENENVQRAERQLAATLIAQGAKVSVVRIPTSENGDKQGVDDFLVANSAAEFQKLLEQASEPESPDAGDINQPANDADPADVAEQILQNCKQDGTTRLLFHRGSFLYWQAGCYREKQTEEIRAEVVKQYKQSWFGVKSRHVGDVLEHIRAETLLRGSLDPPAWLSGMPTGFSADECLATKSAIVHLPSLIANRQQAIVPATPKFFTTNATDFDLDLNAPRPDAWFDFLDSLWSDDQQSIDTLQELLGYLLTTDTRQQKIFLLVGPKRSGKGTIARVIRGLVGANNIVAPTLSSLATNFGLSPLIGKSVGIISDARLSGRPDQGVIVERLLSISGEDAQTVDRKHQSAVTCKLPTRFVIISNELPRLNDASGAVISRMILLHTSESFYGREDHGLTEKLLGELPGILLWSIQGWQRLHQRGRFVQPDSALESLGELNDLASPVGAFVRDCCEVGFDELVSVADLFSAWHGWCEKQGRGKYTGTIQSFGRDLMAAVPDIKRKRTREAENRERVYQGIGLNGWQ